ncbi:MAG TPA: hydrogenase maturation nickel metallochaperone HypA [Syntrophales bacterium]|jgi:hydrogenase nickel incorporation protein HypA/HybF|nr:hydrogenase maturation nickel metallochaperone HypA [Syntrophales bacterium]HPX56449.1 hydrogenase maturation nickel metallochaperone HypA [Syntrophales bacterium]HQA83247.1 hydrogenase maturation nickel metallochaperone HypA [Syntrophales bacterium]
MHELALIQSLLDIVEDCAATDGFCRVNSLKLSFGRLSCLDRQCLEFAFSIQSAGTKAEGAILDFEILPARIRCLDCGREAAMDGAWDRCPSCRSQDVTLTGGTEELRLIEMEVD